MNARRERLKIAVACGFGICIPAGTAARHRNAIEHRGPADFTDRVKDTPLRLVASREDSPPVPEKPCVSCGEPFQPTVKRRLLCVRCFAGADRKPEISGQHRGLRF